MALPALELPYIDAADAPVRQERTRVAVEDVILEEQRCGVFRGEVLHGCMADDDARPASVVFVEFRAQPEHVVDLLFIRLLGVKAGMREDEVRAGGREMVEGEQEFEYGVVAPAVRFVKAAQPPEGGLPAAAKPAV